MQSYPKRPRRAALLGALAALTLLAACQEDETAADATSEEFRADWAAIDAWPPAAEDGIDTQAEPDPERVTTVIVLDDSGSMGSDMEAAKDAVLTAVEQLPDSGRISVLGLNSGMILEPSDVIDARLALPGALINVQPNGNTPLGSTLGEAYLLISREAAQQRGFGTYRIIVTTDGKASDEDILLQNTAHILKNSPVQVSTIGLGIGAGHPLNLPGLTTYAAIDNVAGLADALKAVAAEQTSFQPITDFTEVN